MFMTLEILYISKEMFFQWWLCHGILMFVLSIFIIKMQCLKFKEMFLILLPSLVCNSEGEGIQLKFLKMIYYIVKHHFNQE